MKPDTMDKTREGNGCEGSCEKHIGPIVRVKVIDPGSSHDWGEFNYCEAAIAEDRHRGLTVEIIHNSQSREVKPD